MEKVVKAKRTILVVDDDQDMLVLLEMKLKGDGYQVKVSPNGEHIMEIIAQCHPDLVLLDVNMDGVDGSTICKRLKTNPGTSELPIVLFSANDNLNEVANKCGADAYLSKPYSSLAFKNAFEELIR